MWSVIIADDEKTIRSGMGKFIDWKSLDCMVVYEAKDGEDLIKAVEKFQPNIVITDIKMPVLDGITAASLIRENYPQTEVIFLTAHMNFSYAKAALDMGSVSYIIKTNFLLETPKAVKRAIANMEVISHEKQVILSNIQIRQHLLHNLVHGLISENRLSETEKNIYMDICMKLSRYRMLLVREVQKEDDINKEEIDDKPLRSMLLSMLAKHEEFIFHIAQNKLCVLLCEKEYSCGELLILTRNLVDYSEKFLGRNLVIYIGEQVTGAESVPKLFEEADNVVMNHFPDGGSNIYFRTRMIDENKNGKLKEAVADLLSLIHGHKFSAACERLDAFQELCMMGYEKELLKRQFALLEEECIRYLIYMNPEWKNENTDVFSTQYLFQLFNRLRRLLDECMNTLRDGSLIAEINQFIEEHYMERISLEDIATAIHRNKSYISRIFKEKMNETISDAIRKRKVFASKEMIEKTDLSIQDISAKLGFVEHSYFSKNFKKIEGISPKEYERLVRKKQ
ncbi:MAG: response regulator [Clostridium sp.]|nr:response regulator [Clostridium sp.]